MAPPPATRLPRAVFAGATGALGHAVLRRLMGMQRMGHAHVLATLPISQGMRQISAHVVPHDPTTPDHFTLWPTVLADIALVMFDPPRMFYGRERALWTPAPEQLPALGAWLKACGVHTLVVVLPHAQGQLPASLQRGLASLDEQSVAALGFERLLIVRTAQKPGVPHHRHALHKVAVWMLGVFQYMVPSSEQPVRASKVAEFVDMVLQMLPPGTHVAAPELVWRAAQGDSAQMRRVVQSWLQPPQAVEY